MRGGSSSSSDGQRSDYYWHHHVGVEAAAGGGGGSGGGRDVEGGSPAPGEGGGEGAGGRAGEDEEEEEGSGVRVSVRYGRGRLHELGLLRGTAAAEDGSGAGSGLGSEWEALPPPHLVVCFHARVWGYGRCVAPSRAGWLRGRGVRAWELWLALKRKAGLGAPVRRSWLDSFEHVSARLGAPVVVTSSSE